MAYVTGMTVNDMLGLSLRQAGVNGVGQSPSAADIDDAFTLLNMMLGQWQLKRWLVWALVDTAFTSTGAETYTVGAGGSTGITWTDKLEFAYFRMTTNPGQQVDYPLTIVNSYEDYARIRLKSLTSFPQIIFYDAQFPVGNVHIWPIAQAGYEIHIGTKTVLSQFSYLTDAITLPPEYAEAILLNLSVRLRVMYQLPPDPVLNGLAKSALETMRTSNAQVPQLRMPDGLLHGGKYNIFSDQVNN